MSEKSRYRILSWGLSLGLSLTVCLGTARAQQAPPKAPTEADLYCSGVATDQAIPRDTYVISGEDSDRRSTFDKGDLVFINRGATQGAKVGDEFEVIRPASDPMPNLWFKWQEQLNRAMGTTYIDIGRLRIRYVEEKTSTAEFELSCGKIQRGDIVLPFVARGAPAFHDAKFEPYAAPSGKKTAMVVNSKNFGMLIGTGTTVYVNLGSAQGVQIGDYFRVFRYQGTHIDAVYPVNSHLYRVFGFGSTPVAYQWNDLPRQVLGEGIVMRTGPNSSTVLLTGARQEIFVGDYVELE